MNNSMLRKALEIADVAHFMQLDKQGVKYLYHPLVVALRCNTEEEKIVAILHDVCEDSDYDEEELIEEGFSKEIVDAVCALTRKEDEEYFSYIQRVKENKLARIVKINDLEDNLDSSRGEIPPHLISRYKKAYDYLISFSSQ